MMVLVGRGETTKVRVRNRRIAKGVEQTASTQLLLSTMHRVIPVGQETSGEKHMSEERETEAST